MPSGSVLEREREPCTELRDFSVLDLYVELLDLGDAQVAQRAGRGLHGAARRVFPRLRAGADDFGNAINGVVAFLGHDFSSPLDRGKTPREIIVANTVHGDGARLEDENQLRDGWSPRRPDQCAGSSPPRCDSATPRPGSDGRSGCDSPPVSPPMSAIQWR